ncbi:MAG: zinc ribbon domain-containing protein, partial [Anaerolineae bacterium]|nr:zinc ribbon domain-containing protein [Anaerolineae bacterium]
MLYCPKCGSANRRGSRFCNECGEMLPMYTGLRCPMCGTMNPVQNAYCDQCNARIVPMTAPSEKESEREQPPIRGLSLPTISLDDQPSPTMPPEQEAGEETGDWLTQLRGSTDEGEMETLATEGEEESAEDWLAQLRDSAETVEGVPTPEPEAIAEPIEPAEIPDWLRDLGPVGVDQPPAEAAQEPVPSIAGEAAPEVP